VFYPVWVLGYSVIGIYLDLGAWELVIRRAKGCFIPLKNAELVDLIVGCNKRILPVSGRFPPTDLTSERTRGTDTVTLFLTKRA
jgi:hypothetical protein